VVVGGLTETSVVSYLAGNGLLDPDLQGFLTVRDLSSTHLTFAVSLRTNRHPTGPAHGWFVKQGLGREGRRALARERAAYRELARLQEPGRLAQVVPRLLHDDAAHDVLVVELVAPGESLREQRLREGTFSPGVGARWVRRSLGCTTSRPRNSVAGERTSLRQRRGCWSPTVPFRRHSAL
jgi:hypothetical protein